MSRCTAVNGLSAAALAVALALAPGIAWSQGGPETGQDGGADADATLPQLESLQSLPTLGPSGEFLNPPEPDAGRSPGGQASASDPGFQALSAGREAAAAGNLEAAARHFHDAALRAVPGGGVFREAWEALNFRLPLKRVERLIADQQWREVDESLGRLLERHESDPDKSVYLLRLIAQLQERVPDDARAAAAGNGRVVVQRVEQTLERFRAEQGRYPRGYGELNEVLPADREPLSEYDIVDYVNQGRAYGLTLRNKNDPDNVIQVQRTGLVQ